MRRYGLTVAALLLGLALFTLGGCSEDSPATSGSSGLDDYENIDLSLEYGGLTETDEPEAFDDAYLEKLLAEEDGDLADDSLAMDAAVLAAEEAAVCDTIPERQRPTVYALKAKWGVLDGAVDSLGNVAEDYESLDWSGTFGIDRGTVIIRRLIRFEQPRDHRDPRIDRQTVAWTSHTGPHFDGLLLEIIVPPADEETDAAPNRIHFTTGPFSGSWDVADLVDIDETHEVLPEGNSIRFLSYPAYGPDVCPHGFMGGLWMSMGEGVGFFKGRLVGPFGGFAGLMRGAYGYNDEGEPVIIGKIIGRRGNFVALMRGRWEADESNPGHGHFGAAWRVVGGAPSGRLHGHYDSRPESPHGSFGGRWTFDCNETCEEAIE